MLSEIQKNKFTQRTKKEIKTLLSELNIAKIDNDSICILQEQLDIRVSGLVSLSECEGKQIDEELLEIYDLITDIILDNEEDLKFLNDLFFN